MPKAPEFLDEVFAVTAVRLVDSAVGFSVGMNGKGDVLGLPVADELLGGAGGETAGGEVDEGTEGAGGDNVDGGGDLVTGGGAVLEAGGGVETAGGEGALLGGFDTGGGGELEDGGDGSLAGGGGEGAIV